jgi:NADH dehydrogenase FAD-containing subunit
VSGVDAGARTVLLESGVVRLEYDFLVVATGDTTNDFGVPGAAEHAPPLYTGDQALRMRDRLPGTTVKEVRPDGVLLGDGELIPAELVVWPAVSAPPRR